MKTSFILASSSKELYSPHGSGYDVHGYVPQKLTWEKLKCKKWPNYTTEQDSGLKEEIFFIVAELSLIQHASKSLLQPTSTSNQIQLIPLTEFPPDDRLNSYSLFLTGSAVFMYSWVTKFYNVATFSSLLIVLSRARVAHTIFIDVWNGYVIALCYKATNLMLIIQVLTIFLPWNEISFQAHGINL